MSRGVQGLTAGQRRFVEEDLVDLNATAAMRRAGLGGRHPCSAGSKMLGKAHVKAAVQRGVAQAIANRDDTVIMSRQMVLSEIARIAFTHVRDLAEWGWDDEGKAYLRVRPGQELTLAQSAAVADISVAGGVLKLKVEDRMAALLALARLLGAPGAEEAEGAQSAAAAEAEAAALRERLAAAPRETRQRLRELLAETFGGAGHDRQD